MNEQQLTPDEPPPMRRGTFVVFFGAAAIGLAVGAQLPLMAAAHGAGWLAQAVCWFMAAVIALGAALIADEWWSEN